MKINKKLNLVIPLETDDGIAFVHSAPVGREVFETYFLTLSKTFAAIYGEGLSIMAGPRVAALMLKKISIDLGMWEGVGGVGNGLVGEIRRLTNVIVPAEGGRKTVMLDEALSGGFIDDDLYREIEGHLVFFTCLSHLHNRAQLPVMLEKAGDLWGTQITSLDCTEFEKSLMTSTTDGNSGEKAILSSMPH